MLTEKQIELLESVAVANENISDEKFDMGAWFCGATGCLIGNWLANGPKTNGEKSLRLSFQKTMVTKQEYSFPRLFIGYIQQDVTHDDTLKSFFNFDDEQVSFLFFWENGMRGFKRIPFSPARFSFKRGLSYSRRYKGGVRLRLPSCKFSRIIKI